MAFGGKVTNSRRPCVSKLWSGLNCHPSSTRRHWNLINLFVGMTDGHTKPFIVSQGGRTDNSPPWPLGASLFSFCIFNLIGSLQFFSLCKPPKWANLHYRFAALHLFRIRAIPFDARSKRTEPTKAWCGSQHMVTLHNDANKEGPEQTWKRCFGFLFGGGEEEVGLVALFMGKLSRNGFLSLDYMFSSCIE